MWNTKWANHNVQRVIEKRNILATLLSPHLLRWACVMTVIVTMDQNRRKIKMRNKAKQDKIVLGCDDVSYVILPNVKCRSCQKRARFSRKAGSATRRNVGAAQKKNPSMPKRKIRVAQKKPRGGSG